MNREQKKQHRREVRQRARERELIKARELEEDPEVDEFDVIETGNEPDADSVEKSGHEEAYYVWPPPKSFAELDAARLASEKAEAVREVTRDTAVLVDNILFDQETAPKEKTEAIMSVVEEFSSRVSVADKQESVEKDIDLLQLEAIIAKDRRNEGVTEVVGDFITKAILTAARRNNLDSDKFTNKAHVRAALSYAAQMLKKGGQEAIAAREALPKIHAAAKKLGVGSNMEKECNSILIEKDADGNWRWVGWASNNFIDWDGDIISEDAHKEYVDWWEKNKDVSPVFDTWHVPGTARKSPADFIMYEKGFLIMSGKLEEEEAAGLFRVQKETDLGMSIAAFAIRGDPSDPRVLTQYRMYAVTDLPLEKAANPFTDFETIAKEVGMDKKDYLAQILGSTEKAEAFLEKTGLKQKALQDAQVESKEQEPPPAEEVVEKVEAVAPPEPEPATPPAEPAPDLVAQVMKQMDIEGLNAFVLLAKEDHEKVAVLEGLVKELQGTQEEKLAEVLTPPASRFAWSMENRASQSDDTVVKDGDTIKKSAPGVPEDYWLSTVSGTSPIKIETP